MVGGFLARIVKTIAEIDLQKGKGSILKPKNEVELQNGESLRRNALGRCFIDKIKFNHF